MASLVRARGAGVGSLGAIVVLGFPLLPVILLLGISDTLAALALLVLILVQDGVMIGAALLLREHEADAAGRGTSASARLAFWPTAGWAVLGFGLMLGFELGYIELLDIDESNVEEIGGDGHLLAAFLVALAVIVVAPVAEEFFFRAFFYRALRNEAARVAGGAYRWHRVRARSISRARTALVILPVIAVVGVGLCLVYEAHGLPVRRDRDPRGVQYVRHRSGSTPAARADRGGGARAARPACSRP